MKGTSEEDRTLARSLAVCFAVAVSALIPAVPAQAGRPSVGIRQAVSVAEAGGKAKILVQLSAPSTRTVKVTYETRAGGPTPATAGVDYTPKTGTVTFKPGRTRARATVAILTDDLDENKETFLVTLTGARRARITKDESTVTITDDDAMPSLSLGDASILENAPGPIAQEGLGPMTFATIPVTLSAVSGRQVSVAWSTHDGSATAGVDYQATGFALMNIPAGEPSGVIYVGVYDDVEIEGDETFTVTADDATGATIDDGTSLVTIIDNEACGALPVASESCGPGH